MFERTIHIKMTDKFLSDWLPRWPRQKLEEALGNLSIWSQGHARITTLNIHCYDDGEIVAYYLNKDMQIVWQTRCIWVEKAQTYELHS